MWKHYRGSSNLYFYNGLFYAIVHSVVFDKKRKYFHSIVVFDYTLKPIKYSIPFYFENYEIEYCLSLRISNDIIYLVFNLNYSKHQLT